jgi:heterodisulfide reductase subunit B
MNYAFYPGCSLHSTGLEYGLSTRAVFNHLGSELDELPDWNCCGASSAHSLNHTLALALPARNLAIAQRTGQDLVISCAACYNRMKSTEHTFSLDPEIRAEIEEIIGFQFSDETTIRPALGVLFEDYGLETIAKAVRIPLQGLKLVPYYGCLLVRPPEVAQFDDPDHPHIMSDLLQSAGAQVLEWSYATDCCGGSLSLSRSDVVQGLVGRLVEHAQEAGAQALVTACPLCQVNLEMRQLGEPKMPVFYFTELLGLAFGLPEADRWWRKHLIDPRPLLRTAGLSK